MHTNGIEKDRTGGLIPLTDVSRSPVHTSIVKIFIILTNVFVFAL